MVSTCAFDFLRELQGRSSAEFLARCEEAAEERERRCEEEIVEPEEVESPWPWVDPHSRILVVEEPVKPSEAQIAARQYVARGLTRFTIRTVVNFLRGDVVMQADPTRRAFSLAYASSKMEIITSLFEPLAGQGWIGSQNDHPLIFTDDCWGTFVTLRWLFGSDGVAGIPMFVYEEFYLQ